MAMTKDIELLTYSERQTADGKIYIVARMGLLIIGIVAPRFNAGGDADLQKFAALFASRMDYAWTIANAEKRTDEQRDAEEPLILIDPETGEITDGTDKEDEEDE